MQTTTAPRLGRYRIDTRASTVTFRTRHLFGLAPVRGAFTIRAGTIDIAEPLTDSKVHVEIDAASFTTGNPARDRTVRSARFLDTEHHPTLVFTAEHLDEQTLTGTLTAHGVTRPITLPIERTGMSPGSFTAHADTRVDRTEFGVTASRGMAGRYLDISIDILCLLS